MSDSDVRAWVGEAIIGSGTRIPSLREKRILGAKRWPNPEGYPDLVPTSGLLLFDLQADPACIEPNEDLHIYNPPGPPGKLQPVEIVLYVRKPRQESEGLAKRSL